jgi:hypothetical protein
MIALRPVEDSPEPRRIRYTISRHETKGGAHLDLFLENGDVLLTWRLSAPPETGEVDAEPIGDHRVAYLDYEGPISGDRGAVAIHSTGYYRLNGALLTLHGGPSEGVYVFRGEKLLDARRARP